MHSRWLHRAAGTVGLAGGFLLLGAGAAQADQAEDAQPIDGLLSEVFSPTSGLPPLDLSTETDPALAGLSRGEVPLDRLGFVDGAVGGVAGLPTDGLLQLDGATVGLPSRFATPDFDARTLPATGAPRTLPAPAGPDEIVGPALLGPVTNGLLGGASLGNVVPAGPLVGQVPVAGPMIAQTTGGLPLVGDLVPSSGPAPLPAAAGPAAAGTQQMPAVIAQELAAERGYSPEALDDRAEVLPGLPLLGPALDPLNQMLGVGNLPSQLPLVGPLAGPALGNLPVVGDPAGAPRPAPPAPAADLGQGPAVAPAPAPGQAAAGGPEEVLPLGGLDQALPLDILAVPLSMLNGLPLPL